MFYSIPILIFLLIHSRICYAYVQISTAVYDMAYDTADGVMYVQGGSGIDRTTYGTEIFYGLDLKVSNWTTTSNPPWVQILPALSSPQLPPHDTGHSMVITPDHQNIISWGVYTGITKYTFQSGAWTNITSALPSPVNYTHWRHAAVDPRTGLIYSLLTAGNRLSMLRYDPKSNTTEYLQPPTQFVHPVFLYYSFVWSTQMSRFLLYGGIFYDSIDQTTNQIFNQYMYQYRPDDNTWDYVQASGEQPGALFGQCMVQANSESQMVLFGGLDAKFNTHGSIYILDIGTLNWTKGADIDPTLSRAMMACSSYGDNFVSWGGAQFDTTRGYVPLPIQPVIFNLNTRKWTLQYTLAGNSTGNSTGSPTSGSTTPDQRSTPNKLLAPIIGGVAAGLIILAFVGLYLYKRSKSKQRSPQCNIDEGRIDKDSLSHFAPVGEMKSVHLSVPLLSSPHKVLESSPPTGSIEAYQANEYHDRNGPIDTTRRNPQQHPSEYYDVQGQSAGRNPQSLPTI